MNLTPQTPNIVYPHEWGGKIGIRFHEGSLGSQLGQEINELRRESYELAHKNTWIDEFDDRSDTKHLLLYDYSQDLPKLFAAARVTVHTALQDLQDCEAYDKESIVLILDSLEYPLSQLSKVVVHPGYRKKGCGRFLFKTAAILFNKKNTNGLVVDVTEGARTSMAEEAQFIFGSKIGVQEGYQGSWNFLYVPADVQTHRDLLKNQRAYHQSI